MKVHTPHNSGRMGTPIARCIHKGKTGNGSLKPSVHRRLSSLLICDNTAQLQICILFDHLDRISKIPGCHKLVFGIWSSHKGSGQKNRVVINLFNRNKTKICILYRDLCIFSSFYRISSASSAKNRASCEDIIQYFFCQFKSFLFLHLKIPFFP